MVDLRLAEMVEQAEARNEIACAASRAKIKGVKAEVIPFSSGFLVSGTPGVASAVGAGPRGRLSPAEVREMEAFFERRFANGSIPICPPNSEALHEQLQELGYQDGEEMAVLACIPGQSRAGVGRREVLIEPVRVGTRDLWVRTVSAGFGATDDTPGSVIANIPGVSCYLARDATGEPLGGGAMIRHGRVAILFGDSTLPSARGRGVQKELIRRRLLNARATDCDLATALTVPGSVSQRNYERSGFKAAYTRLALRAAA